MAYKLMLLRNKRILYPIGLILIVVWIVSCVTTYDTISNRNFAHQYDPGDSRFHPEYGVLMISPSDIRLYFRIFPNEFAFTNNPIDSIPSAHVQFFYRATRSYKSIEIVDSLTTVFHFKGKPRPHFMGYIPLELNEKGRYIMELFLTDLNTQTTFSEVLELDYNPVGNQNSFLFLSKHANPLFNTHFSVKDTFRVRSDQFNPQGIRISYYPADTTIPDPPGVQKETFLEFSQVDTSWIVPRPDTCLFSFNKKGVYFFSDTIGIHGKPYLCSGEFYPYVKTPEELLRPLAYLCTPKEMKYLWMQKTPKVAVDSFWIGTSNDLENARELIRVYYQRVQLANYYFTDFKEGWITDRGMIYIIFGAPGEVRKTDDGEYWNYGKNAKDGLEFYFYNEYHPLFGKTCYLERSDIHSRLWFNAVTSWREGRIFSLNK